MPKYLPIEPVIQDWVCELPFMQQALLLTAMRGPDGLSKYNSVKGLVKYMRGTVLKPAHNIHGNQDKFMWLDYSQFDITVKAFFVDTDYYPMHFLMHLIHAAEVIGYKHNDEKIRDYWSKFYEKACDAFHMNPENEDQMDIRLAY